LFLVNTFFLYKKIAFSFFCFFSPIKICIMSYVMYCKCLQICVHHINNMFGKINEQRLFCLTSYYYHTVYPLYHNINWSDVQNVVNNAYMSGLRAPWQNGPYKSKRTEQHKYIYTHTHVTPKGKRQSFFCVLRIFLFLLFIYDVTNEFSKKCWFTALERSMVMLNNYVVSFNSIYFK